MCSIETHFLSYKPKRNAFAPSINEKNPWRMQFRRSLSNAYLSTRIKG